MFHYGRDVQIALSTQTYSGNKGDIQAIAYHFARVAGFDWLWECDSEVGTGLDPNHAADGNMEAVGTGSYAAVNTGQIAKDTAIFERGTQSLRITSKAANDGARTVALLSMTNELTRAFDPGDTLTGPVGELVTLLDDNSPFTSEIVGCLVTISGEANPGNNGTFLVRTYESATTIKIENPTGVNTVAPAGLFSVRRPYEIVLWARNSSGVTWNVDVDQGDGAYVNVGTIPDNGGVWTQYHFQFATLSTGDRYIRIVDPNWSVDHSIYIDSMIVFRSCFEYVRSNRIGDGAAGNYAQDGELINPDTFSSASYVPSAKDIGSYLFVWDPNPAHTQNSGVYKIIAAPGGGVVQLDLRSGTAALTAATGLRWRIIDWEQYNRYYKAAANVFQRAPGFGIQSPHSSKWRFFWRGVHVTGASHPASVFWASPEDTGFDFTTGQFYKDGPSTQRTRQLEWSYVNTGTGQHCATSPYGNGDMTTRAFLMTDDTCSFLNFVHFYSATSNGGFSVGYTGADADHPGIEEFALIAAFTMPYAGAELVFTGGDNSMWGGGTTFSPLGEAVEACLAVLGMHQAGAADSILNQTNNGVNPWSGEEWLQYASILRDPTGRSGYGSLREATGLGIRFGRTTLSALATFDSNQYLHFAGGYCWEWNGVTVL